MSNVTALRKPIAPPVPALPAAAASAIDASLIEQYVPFVRRRIRGGQHVYRAGQPCQALHLVHAGLFKSMIASEDGREKVTGFHLRGALLGLESFGRGEHVCDAVALDDGEVWEIDSAAFLAACARHPELQHAFASALAGEILLERRWMLTVGTLGAEQRVAALLLDLGERLHALGFSATRFVLRMTRAEIGSFLGLKLETVTRAMTTLFGRGLIGVKRREIDIVDAEGLRKLIAVPMRTH